jgi:hypothetical protein
MMSFPRAYRQAKHGHVDVQRGSVDAVHRLSRNTFLWDLIAAMGVGCTQALNSLTDLKLREEQDP